MKLELEIASSLCWAQTFVINGVKADPDDFGEKYDHDEDNAPDYGCGDMRFTRIPPTEAVLQKYNITAPEYNLVAGQLEEGLSFGRCGWCV